MTRFKLTLVTIFAAAVLAGCGTISNPARPEKATATPPPQYGTVVFSAEAPSPCISESTDLLIAPAGSDYARNLVSDINVDNWALASDFDDHLGSLSVLTLPAGDYEIYPHILNPYVEGKVVSKALFSVKSGEAVYIGNFYMPVSCGLRTQIQLRDLADRDLPLVRRKNPEFANVVFKKRFASYQGGYVLGGPSDPRLVIAPGQSSPDPAPGSVDARSVPADDTVASTQLPACTKEQLDLKKLAEQQGYRFGGHCY